MGTLRRWRWPIALVGLAAAVVAAVVLFVGGGDGETPTPAAPTPAAPTPAAPVVAESDVASEGDFRFHLVNGRCNYATVVTGQQTVTAENGVFCLVSVDITYGGQEPATLDQACQYLIDATGTPHTIRSDVLALERGSARVFARPFQPGQESDDVGFYYDVPTGTDPESLELHASCDSRGLRIPLRFQGTTPVED